MKGYREFSPVIPESPSLEPVLSEQGTIEWEEQSLLAEEGFRPY